MFSVGGSCYFIKHGVHEIQAKLAAMQAKFVFYDVQPLFRLRPAFDREARINAQV
jgi:hypothetical protein